MLGDVVRCQVAPKDPVVSTVFMDRVLSAWNDSFDYAIPTLVERNNIWEEFWLSSSDTKNWCPRACALRAFSDPISSPMQTEMAWRMEIGKAYHKMLQDVVMQKTYGSDLLGAWVREGLPVPIDMNVQDTVEDGSPRIIARPFFKKPDDGHKYYYNESKIRMPKHRIVMKLDGILNQVGTGLEVVEFKTEQDSAYDTLSSVMGGGPRKHHIEQINLCMWATGIHKGRIVYVFKGDKTMLGSVLECEIDYDADLVDRLKRVALSCVDAVNKCDEWKLTHDDITDENYETEKLKFLDSFKRYDECPMKSKGRAQRCYARDLCFVKKAKAA